MIAPNDFIGEWNEHSTDTLLGIAKLDMWAAQLLFRDMKSNDAGLSVIAYHLQSAITHALGHLLRVSGSPFFDETDIYKLHDLVSHCEDTLTPKTLDTLAQYLYVLAICGDVTTVRVRYRFSDEKVLGMYRLAVDVIREVETIEVEMRQGTD